MKGIVFREFIAMVEDQFSIEDADAIISASDLETGGAYTSVGTYSHEEMVQLVTHLSGRTGIPIPDLLRGFGRHLFSRFAVIHASHVSTQASVFDLLAVLENQIHVEVRKIYSEAELPSFEHEKISDDCLILTYRSKRSLADFAEGLLLGCIAHFNEIIHIERADIHAEDGAHTRFTLSRQHDARAV
jgi:hypothetical protein